MDLTDGTRRGVAAVLFLQAGMVAFDAMSTVNSSPWTAENVGSDETRRASLERYVTHAIVVSTGYAAVASIIAGSIIPLVGATLANIYLWYLYDGAVRRAQAAGPTSFGSMS